MIELPPLPEPDLDKPSQVFESVFDAIADTPEEAATMKARAEIARNNDAAAAIRSRGDSK